MKRGKIFSKDCCGVLDLMTSKNCQNLSFPSEGLSSVLMALSVNRIARSSAKKAIESIMSEIPEIITTAQQVQDEEVLLWVANSLFRVTVSADDESAEHVVFSDESEHPYRPNENVKKHVSVSGATSLQISFDELSCLESGADFLAFYRDEECTKLIDKKLS